MKIIPSLLFLPFFGGAVSASFQLRHLQDGEVDQADIIKTLQDFTPALSASVQDLMKNEFDPVVVGNETTMVFNWGGINGTSCGADATITYGVGEVAGFGNVIIDSITLVPESVTYDAAMMGLAGATWSAEWNVTGQFPPSLIGSTGAIVNATICGVPVNQEFTGSITVQNPTTQMKVWLSGTSDTILASRQASQVTAVLVKEFDMSFDDIDITLDSTGNSFIMDMDMTFFNGLLQDEINNNLEPLVMALLQQEMTAALPFTP